MIYSKYCWYWSTSIYGLYTFVIEFPSSPSPVMHAQYQYKLLSGTLLYWFANGSSVDANQIWIFEYSEALSLVKARLQRMSYMNVVDYVGGESIAFSNEPHKKIQLRPLVTEKRRVFSLTQQPPKRRHHVCWHWLSQRLADDLRMFVTLFDGAGNVLTFVFLQCQTFTRSTKTTRQLSACYIHFCSSQSFQWRWYPVAVSLHDS